MIGGYVDNQEVQVRELDRGYLVRLWHTEDAPDSYQEVACPNFKPVIKIITEYYGK